MFNVKKKELTFSGNKLKLEVGKIARQASSAVVISMGETVVLCTVVASPTAIDNVDFLPLSVHYQEKFYAAGKVPGGFIKRESKPSEREMLISRLVDRSIRPLFPENWRREVQIICTVLSYDPEFDPDILSVIGTSAALSLSSLPILDITAAVRVGYSNGQFSINTAKDEGAALDLLITATKDSVIMVESAAQELSNEIMISALQYGAEQAQPIIDMIKEFTNEAGQPKQPASNSEPHPAEKAITDFASKELTEIYLQVLSKQELADKLEQLTERVISKFVSDAVSESLIKSVLQKLSKASLREHILENKVRLDGRGPADIRQINCELDLLPRAHSSALFTRGETQALVVTTLGTAQDEQTVDDLLGNRSENFMLHYNFPPYSVGEASILKAPGRREIGHGKLAYKALLPVVPNRDEFPYSIRVVSEITESNGSSSMASVCGGSLAMMAAGVPLKSPVSGIAMGLVLDKEDKNRFVVLSDIMGAEDQFGDMDFKVAGTANGITALQMDMKVAGINLDILKDALNQAESGRTFILREMDAAISSSREGMSQYAPKIFNIKISKNKIRELIGPGGKVIKNICEESTAKIDIDDDGNVTVSALSANAMEKAIEMINAVAEEPVVGRSYNGQVTKIVDFGAFVRFLGTTEGLLHISELSLARGESVAKVLFEGQKLTVSVSGIEKRGNNNRINLTVSKEEIERCMEDSAQSNSLRQFNNPPTSSRKTSKPYRRDSTSPSNRASGNYDRDRGNAGAPYAKQKDRKRFV